MKNSNSPLYFGDRPRRLVGDGKHTVTHTESGGVHYWRCVNEECGWWTSALGMMKEEGEERAWLHISRPDLLIVSSSDIYKTTRMLTGLEQDKRFR